MYIKFDVVMMEYERKLYILYYRPTEWHNEESMYGFEFCACVTFMVWMITPLIMKINNNKECQSQ